MKEDIGIALTKCFFCGEGYQIVMNTRLSKLQADKVKALDGMVMNDEPCPKCKELMEQGVMLISVRDGEGGKNPYRTGSIAVVKDKAIKRMIQPVELAEDIIKKRMAFVPDEAWEAFGLPRENIDNR